MLKSLTVENYALISLLEMELSPGLNIVTGETGAGKSILLGALGMLLGNRAETNSLHDKEKNCVVEGIFDVAGYGLEGFFDDNDLEFEKTTSIRRVITPAGKSRAYVNDLPVQLSLLKELGGRLLDIHSQHQSLMVGNEIFRLGILDSVAGNADLATDYRAIYSLFRAKRKELANLRDAAAQNSRDEDYLRFQCDELCGANLREGEQEELEDLLGQLSHAQEIKEVLIYGTQVLGEDETGVLVRLKNVLNSLGKLKNVYGRGGDFAARIQGALVELKELEREIEDEYSSVDSDPTALEKTRERLDTLYALQQKHRVQDVAGLVLLRDEYSHRLEAITHGAQEIDKIVGEVDAAQKKAIALANKITQLRGEASVILKRETQSILSELGMPNAVFEAEISDAPELGNMGGDNVRFLFSANRSSAPMPVEKIASGGEISRLMLALKSIVASKTKLPTIIFDEIDAGVSGQIADCMGTIISRMAGDMQIVNITHLPQVASKGDTHFLVYKEDSEQQTQTLIRRLSTQERIAEIAKMLSGSKVTDAAITQAKLLLDGNI